jgi:hypothetical protein
MILDPITLGNIDWQSNDRFGTFADTRENTQTSAEGRKVCAYTKQSKPTDAQVGKNSLVTIKAPAIVAHFGCK